MIEALQLPFFQRALAAGLLAAVAAGIVGTWIVVKRVASISGGLAHAAFGGVGLGYWAGFSPLAGATGFALLCGLGIAWASRRFGSALDTLVAIVWAVGMALGMLLVALTPGYAPDLLGFLFGSILFVPPGYLVAVAVLDVVLLAIVVLRYRQVQAAAFDEEFAEVMGLPVGWIDHLSMAIVALTVVVLIQVVGVILVIALLTIPAATAQRWSTDLRSMMLLSGALAAAAVVGGLFSTYALSDVAGIGVPTGPVIILVAAALFGIGAAAGRVR